VQFWLAPRGANAGYHNHADNRGSNAFCEVHSCVVNASGSGGMFLRSKLSGNETDVGVKNDSEKRGDYTRILVPSCFEHGPLCELDATGRPLFRSDGSMVYRYHAWIAGDGPNDSHEPAFDFWWANELNPKIVRAKTAARAP
jgi:hypothetical protein